MGVNKMGRNPEYNKNSKQQYKEESKLSKEEKELQKFKEKMLKHEILIQTLKECGQISREIRNSMTEKQHKQLQQNLKL